MMKRILSVLFTILLITSCSKLNKKKTKEDSVSQNYDHHIARYISHVSSDIFPDSPIVLRFVSSMIPANKIGKEIEEEILAITPDVRGKTIWKDKRTIHFVPNKKFSMRKEYNVKIDVSKLSKEMENVADHEFKVNIKGREINFLDGKFIQTEEDQIYYAGKIKFTYKIEKEIVKKEMQFCRGNKKIDLLWKGDDVGREFNFKTTSFKHDENNKLFKIKLSKKRFELSDDYEVEFSSFSFSEIKIVHISKNHDESNPSIEIDFSSELDKNQILEGLISIEPNVNPKINKLEKKIIVTGDFEFGKEYTLIIDKNIRNKFSNNLGESSSKKFAFNDLKPQITFSSDGCILPSGNNKKILFQTLNLKEVTLIIDKVFENNLGYFLQTDKLSSLRNKNNYYSNMNRVGINYINKKLRLGEKRNEWLQHELDLSKLIPDDDNGLYVIKLQFNENQILYRGVGSKNRNRYDASSPYSRYYYNNYGSVSKTIILSDIGLTWLKTEDEHIIYVTDLNTTEPISGAKVSLMTYQNQLISQAKTNSQGKITFPTGNNTFYIYAEHKNQRSFLKKNEMQWNLSTFKVDGVQNPSKGTRAYIYTERGIYRPGDEINISMIFRNKDNTFPENHPVNIIIRNPQNKVVLKYTLKKGYDGYYNFKYKTEQEDMTGNWNFTANVGNSQFSKQIKIETVVAERLKIKVTPEKEEISIDDKEIKINLLANYLFGNPASKLKAKLICSYYKVNKSFDGYRAYIFDNETKKLETEEKTIFDGKLDENGKSTIVWHKPYLGDVPSGLNLKLSAEVQEPGGRSSKHWEMIPLDSYKAFVGIEKPESKYLKTNSQNHFNIILLNSKGMPLVGQELSVKIFHNRNYWWWEYDSNNRSKLHFKTNYETELIKETIFKSEGKPSVLDFVPEQRGKYLIEVSHETQNGHSAAIFVTSSYWGNSEGGMKNAGLLTLTTDKQKYHPGETAIVQCPVPENANVLVSIDKGYQNLDTYWLKSIKDKTATIEIPVNKEMLPPIYCSVSVIQPHSQTDNDRPIRMFGVIPIAVDDNSTNQGLKVVVPQELRPNQKFSCEVKTLDRAPTQFTIAIVDEGLLSLTNFQTPDAKKEFFQKLRLGVSVFDNLSHIIGTNKGDIFKTFSVGGDMEYRKQQLSPTKVNRFKPVSIFKGPIRTDKNGYAKVDFEMPEYIGAVRLMVVSTNESRFGNYEKTIPVKTEMMILPTLPRVLAPGDKFQLPVTIFSLDEDIRDVKISLDIDGAVKCTRKTESIKFNKKGDKQVFFDLSVQNETGKAKIKINAVSEKYTAESNTEIAIRPISPRIYHSEHKVCPKESSVKFKIPQNGIKGTNNVSITISKQKKVDFHRRLKWLIRYPYGCLEQTTSSGFPQLYLKNNITLYDGSISQIDRNINKTISRLRSFQKINGSFSYWPNRDSYNAWSEIYAGHFLVEAQKLGYYVPSDLIDNWKRNIKSITVKNQVKEIKWDAKYNRQIGIREARIQIYRLFVLALIDEPEIGAMNLMNELNLDFLDDMEKWQLAACYKLAGLDKISRKILKKTGILVKDYTEMSGTYGSSLRDKSMILYAMLILDNEKQTRLLYEDIIEVINDRSWYSTQSLAFALLAVGKYMDKYSSDFIDNAVISGSISNSQFPEICFESNEELIVKKVPNNANDFIKVNIDGKSEINGLNVSMNWDGIPLKPLEEVTGKGILLSRRWYNENDEIIDPAILKQGDIVTLKIIVDKTTEKQLENAALMQIIPSGWEIENERISDNDAYSTSNGLRNNRYNSRHKKHEQSITYTDIRDDRIMWFFDMNQNVKNLEFIVILRAVTVGEFYFSPTKCEMMYSDKFKAIIPGFEVRVEK